MRLSVSIRTDVRLWLVYCCTLYLLAHSINCLTSGLKDMVGMAVQASYAMVHCHSQRPNSELYSLYIAQTCMY